MPAVSHKPPLKDRLIPWYFVLGFLVVFAVNGVFVTVALRTHRGVVTSHAYEEGRDYNHTLAEAAKQAVLGWQVHAELLQGSSTPELHYTLHDHTKTPLSGARAIAYFSNPTQDGADFNIPLQEARPGEYHAEIHFPHAGQWDMTIVTLWNQQHHQLHQRLMIR